MEFYEDALKPETRDFYNEKFGFQYVALIGLRSLRFCAFIMNCLWLLATTYQMDIEGLG